MLFFKNEIWASFAPLATLLIGGIIARLITIPKKVLNVVHYFIAGMVLAAASWGIVLGLLDGNILL